MIRYLIFNYKAYLSQVGEKARAVDITVLSIINNYWVWLSMMGRIMLKMKAEAVNMN